MEGGVTLVGDEVGPRGGRPVLLLHGGGQTRHAWKGAGPRLAELGYHVVALDARGHGESSWAPDGDYSPQALVEDLVAVARRVCPNDRPVLVGASVGGGTVLSAVGEGLIDAAALVLVDVAPRVEGEGAAKIFEFMRSHPNGFASLESVSDAIASYQPHRPRRTDLSGLAKNVREGENGRYRWHWDPRFMEARHDLEARQIEQERCARAVRCPALLIRGALSDVVSEAGAREFLACCRDAEYINVEAAAHMVVGDRNDVFLDALIEFVARVAPPRRAP